MASLVVDLGYVPRPWQREVHLALKRFSVLPLHRRAGKTVLSVAELVDKALRFELPHGRFGYIAPFLKQAKAIAWAKLKQRIAPLIERGLVDIYEGELRVVFKHNGAQIMLFGADNADAIRGDYFDGVVLDEVAQMAPEVWFEIVRPMLADRKGWALFIGTPNGVNLFSEIWQNALANPAQWCAKSYTCYETDALDPGEIEDMRREMNVNAFAREMLCDFTAAGDNQLISLADVEAAARRQLKPSDYEWAPRIIGVDPARFGNDNTVIVGRQGLKVDKVIAVNGIDNMAVCDRIIAYFNEWGADCIFVDEGNGAGVIDYLKRLGYPVIGVSFGAASSKPMYYLKRSEIWCEMADWLPLAAIPNELRLKQDLSAPVYTFNPKNQKVLERKDETKERILRSPDYGDALAVTFAQPVERRKTAREQFFEQHSNRSPAEYDPYALG